MGIVDIVIRGGTEAAHYVLGKTSQADWERIRTSPAPWAELETEKIILTVPSDVVQALDDPEDLMKFWDRVSDACAELAGWPLDRPRAERYVTDIQISVGYMHSGYPIMTFLDVAPVLVDKPRILADGHGGVWGFFHELGHNHQSPDWTFDGTVEVTVNLFTLYVYDQVHGIKAENLRDFDADGRRKRIEPYLAEGAPFEKWKSDPFLALIMYIQLQEVFGWDAYKQVFAEYRDLSPSERPRTEEERRDQWMVRMSRTVGKNLGPFFQTWGVPTSKNARDSISDLPDWMPEGFPQN